MEQKYSKLAKDIVDYKIERDNKSIELIFLFLLITFGLLWVLGKLGIWQ